MHRGNLGAAILGLTIGALYLIASPTSATAATKFDIAGRVVNGTVDGSVPHELVVSLERGSLGEKRDRRETIARDGTFYFSGLEAESGDRFVLITRYLGVGYRTVVQVREADIIQARLEIYETTNDDAVIAVTSDLLTLIEGSRDSLEALQLLTVRNPSDRTLVALRHSPSSTTLRLPVVESAVDILPVRIDQSGGIAATAQGISLKAPILPGVFSISYRYRLDMTNETRTLNRLVVYPTAQLDVALGSGLTLGSPDLSLQEAGTLMSRDYRWYRGGPFPPGVSVSGIISRDSVVTGGSRLIPVTVAALILTSGFVVMVKRRRRPQVGPESTIENREDLIEAIARLDLAYQAGLLSQQEYLEERARMKWKLETLAN